MEHRNLRQPKIHIKRPAFDRFETANTIYWEFREGKYSVRSTMLGGDVVSEVDGTGGKLKTIVRAAGATLLISTAREQPARCCSNTTMLRG